MDLGRVGAGRFPHRRATATRSRRPRTTRWAGAHARSSDSRARRWAPIAMPSCWAAASPRAWHSASANRCCWTPMRPGGSRTARCAAAGWVVGARYYFRQSPRRLLFLGLSAERWAHNLDADQQILLGGDTGLRGYPLRYQAGDGRWLFTAEQRFFTSWYPFQLFNVGAAVFYDMGATWGRDPLGTPSAGPAAGRGLRPAPRQQPLGARQCAARRRRVSARRRLLDSQRAIPGRDQEELLMLGMPNHSRPMIRVETLVLIVTAWIVATANGAWWKAIGQGRDWSQPGNWLFMICCFITLVGLHFAVLAPFAIAARRAPAAHAAGGRERRRRLVHEHLRGDARSDHDPERAAHRRARGARAAESADMIAWVLLWSALPLACIWLVRLEHLHCAAGACACAPLSVFAALVHRGAGGR